MNMRKYQKMFLVNERIVLTLKYSNFLPTEAKYKIFFPRKACFRPADRQVESMKQQTNRVDSDIIKA
jgi:hypothetical protein